MTSFRVTPTELDQGATKIDQLATGTNDIATKIEGACASPPKVGDVQATAVFQQAHYDWTQTRFEDLMASRANLATLAENLRATAKTYAQSDAQAAEMLFKILDELDTLADGTGR